LRSDFLDEVAHTPGMTTNLRAVARTLLGVVAGLLPTLAHAAHSDAPVYLFSTFKEPEQDGLRFAFSHDGHHWSNVPGLFLKARVGRGLMRDPSVARGSDGTWHLVWTTAWRGDPGFGYADSKDLVHWSEQQFVPVMAHEPTTVNVWAPELFFDDKEGRFIICWASTIPGRFPDDQEARTNNHRMYYTTTRDFKTFAPTKLFLDPGFSVIDCRILKVASRSSGRESAPSSSKRPNGANLRSLPRDDERRYVLLLKDNTRPQRNLRVAFGDSPLGPWKDFSAPFTDKLTEGPTALKIGDDWLIYYDAYGRKAYGAAKTRDFKQFTDVTGEMTFPPGLKHGTAFVATRKDLAALLGASPP
jgi:hypothetical protein